MSPARGSLGIHPKLGTSLQAIGHFPQMCKIQQEVKSRTATGDVNATWQDVVGMEEIACAVSKVTPDRETRIEEETKDATRGKILLLGTWPQIGPTMRAVVAGDAIAPAYDIEDVNIGWRGGVTELEVRYLPQAAQPGVE